MKIIQRLITHYQIRQLTPVAPGEAQRLRIALLPDELVCFRVERGAVNKIGSGGASTWIFFDRQTLRKAGRRDFRAAVREELHWLEKIYGERLVYTTLGDLRKVARQSGGLPEIEFYADEHYKGHERALVVDHREVTDPATHLIAGFLPIAGRYVELENLPYQLKMKRGVLVKR